MSTSALKDHLLAKHIVDAESPPFFSPNADRAGRNTWTTLRATDLHQRSKSFMGGYSSEVFQADTAEDECLLEIIHIAPDDCSHAALRATSVTKTPNRYPVINTEV